MRRMLLILCLLLPAFATGAQADDDGTEAEKAEVAAATAAWVEAFNARDPERIAALYAPDAVFWGTISKTIRTHTRRGPGVFPRILHVAAAPAR